MDEVNVHSTTTDRSPVAGEGVEQARKIGLSARQRVIRLADEKKDEWADGIENLASRLASIAKEEGDGQAKVAGGFMGDAADQLRSVSGQIRNKSADELLEDVQEGMRKRPGVVIAGALAIGFLAARMFRE